MQRPNEAPIERLPSKLVACASRVCYHRFAIHPISAKQPSIRSGGGQGLAVGGLCTLCWLPCTTQPAVDLEALARNNSAVGHQASQAKLPSLGIGRNIVRMVGSFGTIQDSCNITSPTWYIRAQFVQRRCEKYPV